MMIIYAPHMNVCADCHITLPAAQISEPGAVLRHHDDNGITSRQGFLSSIALQWNQHCKCGISLAEAGNVVHVL